MSRDEDEAAPADAVLAQKQKQARWNVSDASLSVLEQAYQKDPFPGLDVRRELATQLSASERQVQVWFQNKRQRERRPPPAPELLPGPVAAA